jgi:hypothetical protein
MSVHEAPKDADFTAPTAQPQQSADTETPAEQPAADTEDFVPTPQAKPHNQHPLPVGTIIATLFVMAVLATITVMVYLQS